LYDEAHPDAPIVIATPKQNTLATIELHLPHAPRWCEVWRPQDHRITRPDGKTLQAYGASGFLVEGYVISPIHNQPEPDRRAAPTWVKTWAGE
jgi:hypothetical protein